MIRRTTRRMSAYRANKPWISSGITILDRLENKLEEILKSDLIKDLDKIEKSLEEFSKLRFHGSVPDDGDALRFTYEFLDAAKIAVEKAIFARERLVNSMNSLIAIEETAQT